MSINKYNSSTGELTTLASGTRTWVGTKEAYKEAKQAGTLPNNAIIAITNDEQDHNHYSTDEVETGMYWIDRKPIYRKVVDCGALPSTPTYKNIAHNITDFDTVISIKGIANHANGIYVPLPYPQVSTYEGNVISLYVDNTNIHIGVNDDMHNYVKTYVTIEYTKTID